MTLTADTVNPPTLWGDDEPRVPFSHPVESHAAADESQATKALVMSRVLTILWTYGPMNGLQLNTQYALSYRHDDNPRGWDTPRKRTTNLVEAGLIEPVGAVTRGTGRTFRLTDKGRAAVNA